ncbi:MAG: TetR/AcrR family transcriptional regulator [Spirillospora sp.]
MAEPRGRTGNRRGGRRVVRDPEGARRALLASAVRLFEKNGYSATSVQSVVDGAGLTKGAFYHHFASKEDLLLAVHDEFIDYQLYRARQIVAKDMPADTMLRQLTVEVLLEPLSVYKAEITVFLQERKFLSGEMFAGIQEKRGEFERCFVDVIERGMDEGVFRRVGPPRLVAFGIIGMAAWTHVWLDSEGPVSPTELGEIYAEMLIDGLHAAGPA